MKPGDLVKNTDPHGICIRKNPEWSTVSEPTRGHVIGMFYKQSIALVLTTTINDQGGWVFLITDTGYGWVKSELVRKV